MSSKKVLKNTLLWVLRKSGGYQAVSGLKGRSKKLLILCFHGVALRDEEVWRGALYISPQQFRRRLEVLKSWEAKVLPLSEGLERLRAGSLPPRSVVLTFDDGFHDFSQQALPILSEFGYPSTVYVSTYYARHRLPIFNLVLDYLCWKSGREELSLPGFAGAKTQSIRSAGERSRVVESTVKWADGKNMSTAEKNEFAGEVAQALGIAYDDLVRSRILQIMSPEEIAAVAKAGVQVELHTHRHRTPSDRELFQREIRDNRACIREYTGREAFHFCYPSGKYAPEFLPWLRELKVQSATTCDLGLANADSETLLLPRVSDAANMTELDFESWVLGVRS